MIKITHQKIKVWHKVTGVLENKDLKKVVLTFWGSIQYDEL